MNKTNYINLNEETENNFTTSKNNDIMKLYGRLKEISGRNKQNGWDAKTTVPNVPKIPDMWGGMDNGKSKHKRPSEHNKPHPLPNRPDKENKPKPLPNRPSKEKELKPRPLPRRPFEQGEPELILRPGKPSEENRVKPIPLHIPKEKKEQERLKRATGDYDLKKIDPEKIKEYLRLKEKTPDDYYSLSVPRKELDERLNKEAFGPKTDFSVWNFENNYDKLNKEEQSMLIHKMQLAFNNEGYKDDNGYSLKTDGIFGDKTKSVYEQYKKDKKDELEDYEPEDKKIVEGEDYQVLKDENGKPVLLASTDVDLSGIAPQSTVSSTSKEDFYFKFPEPKFDINLWQKGLESKEERQERLQKEKEEFREGFTKVVKAIVEGLDRTGKVINPIANYGNKQLQKIVWKTGAELYLKKYAKCYTSAWMLEHSLQDNPEKVVRDNDSAIAYKINHSKEYLEALDEAIANSKDGVIDQELQNISFSDRDLYFSLNKATVHVKGYKAEDGHWYISATLKDTYDFTEILFLEKGMSGQKFIGALANNAAVISQLTDVITPYEVEVNFYTRR